VTPQHKRVDVDVLIITVDSVFWVTRGMFYKRCLHEKSGTFVKQSMFAPALRRHAAFPCRVCIKHDMGSEPVVEGTRAGSVRVTAM
jgi:hypothetical protein